jgi:hypothetical protein
MTFASTATTSHATVDGMARNSRTASSGLGGRLRRNTHFMTHYTAV